MSFLAPAYLWGLIALTIPIIVHFFYLRRSRKYEFSQAALVEQLRRASRPILRLRHWLLLLLRLALVTVVVFLFARPKISPTLSPNPSGASVVIIWDVSPSMTPAFPQAYALLEEAIQRDPPLYEYKLLTTDSYLPKGGFVSARLLMERLRSVRPASMGYSIASFLEQSELLFSGAQYLHRKVYIVSDFQRSSVGPLTRLRKESLGEIVLIPISNSLSSNAYIDSLHTQREGGQWRIHYRLRGEAGKIYPVQVNGQQRSLLPGNYEESLPLTAKQISINIAGDGIDFDNQVSAGLQESPQNKVLWTIPLSEAFLRLHRLLGIEPLRDQTRDEWQAVSIWVGELGRLPESIATWTAEGGNLILFPPTDLSPSVWQKVFLSAEIPFPQANFPSQPLAVQPVNSSFWEGVFFSGNPSATLAEPLTVKVLYRFQHPTGRVLLRDDQGNDLLWEIPVGRGRVYLFAFPLEGSNLSYHSLCVPLFARLYRWEEETEESLWKVEAGKRRTFRIQSAERPRLRHIATDRDYIPPAEKRGPVWHFSFGDQPLPLGLYEVRDEKEAYGYVGLNTAVEESSSPPLPLTEWEQAGLSVRTLSWEDGQLVEKRLTFGWRDWHVWLILAVILIATETYWARSLLRPNPATVPLQ
ncbi:MAG: BatA domain-containing protein [Bacteroidia bacterium]|nr:BatA domain-containing protein [Bacteroidia bacterium]